MAIICCSTVGLWYVWDQFGQHGPPTVPNEFVINPKVTGLIKIVSPKNVMNYDSSPIHMKIDQNIIILSSTFSDGNGTWISRVGTKTYGNLYPYGKDSIEEGVWGLGTVTSPEFPDHQVYCLYVGKAFDALIEAKSFTTPQFAGDIEKIIGNP